MIMNDTLIKELSEKLGTTSEYIFETLVKQAKFNAIEGIVFFLLSLLFLFILYKVHKHLSENYLYDDVAVGVMLFFSIIFIFILIISLIKMISNLSGLYNPEYWAIKQIFNSLNQN